MGEAHHTLGPFGPQRVKRFALPEAPRSGPRRASGGSSRTGVNTSRRSDEAPRSGPRRAPGGQYKKEQEDGMYTTCDDRFRTGYPECARSVIVLQDATPMNQIPSLP